MLKLSFHEYLFQGQRLASALDAEEQELYLNHFPDGESLLRLPTTLSDHVIICRSLNQPNDKLIE